MSWCHIYYITSVILYIYSGYVTASEYYVSAAPNGESCSSAEQPCHNLSYYIANFTSYFTDDTVFYFLEGTHTLQNKLEISGVSNITLQGLGHIEQGFHETVKQSTSVIRCGPYTSGGMMFSNSTQVVLILLTVTNCMFKGNSEFQTNIGLHFYDINNVTMKWISVQNGSGLGLFLQNAFNVLIADSSFAQNQHQPGNCTKGNAYLEYVDTKDTETWYGVDIVRSNFSFGLNDECYTDGFSYATYTGGLSIGMHSTAYKLQINIDFVILYGNIGYIGGNFAINTNGNLSLVMNNTSISYGNAFIQISDEYIGGGMTLNYYDTEAEVEIFIENTNFSHNVAMLGGGLVFLWYDGGRAHLYNCIIYNNTGNTGSGVTIAVQTYFGIPPIFYFNKINIDSNHIFIQGDDQYQAAVFLLYVSNITFDQVLVSNHNTTGLMSFRSSLIFMTNNQFVNNSGISGGGIALYDSSYLLLKERSNISFINNHAKRFGGGIYVSQVVNRIEYFQCFFQDISYTFDDIMPRLYFINNSASISGDVLYGGNVDTCSGNESFKPIFNYTLQTGLSVVSSDPIQICFCESGIPVCSKRHDNKTVLPGRRFNISLAAVGSQNGTTSGSVQLTEYPNKLNSIVKKLSPHNCMNITYMFNITSALSRTAQVYVTLEKTIDPLNDTFAKIIYATIESCPIGFELNSGICDCRSELLRDNEISCDINTQNISREGNLWIGYQNDSNCFIVYENCPFDYCNDSMVLFKIISPDPQCLHSRSGILCGQCSEGLSLMLGSNQCRQCSNNYIALIILFALAGIALIAFVIALNLTVSVGTINGLIFYANVVKIYEHIFFHKGPIHFLSQFISWINLDLGIETCFIDGMGSCSKTWLQFIFPGYVWFLLILIIILSRYSSKVVRLMGRQVIPALATMILLSYTKLIRTVFLVLHYTDIPCKGENNDTFKLWYVDTTVPYLRGCHLPLFLFSLAILILLIVPYTFYLLTIPLLEGPLSKYMCYQKLSTYMKPFSDAYGGPYKDKCRFWTGFLLLVRVVLALVVSLDIETTISLDVLTSILVIINFMYLPLRGVYRQLPLVCLELFFILNLILLASTNGHTSNENMNLKGQVSTIVLISLTFVVFCGILIYHIWDRFLKSHLLEQIKKLFKTQSNIPSDDDNEIEIKISSVDNITYSVMPELREPLLDDQDDIIHKK